MNKLMRIFKHRWWDAADTRRVVGPVALESLEARVQASESRHTGEIRLCIEGALPWSYLWRGATARERALAMFGKLQVWDTEQNNGVLIYLLLVEHRIEVVADRGVARQVPQAEWDRIVHGMSDMLKQGHAAEALGMAVDAVSALLERHFPAAAGEANPDELPNRPHLL
ncbi:TPM domain-containing protein [Aquabacterium sp. A7-Y]|uniref:TPM domain-containing protein n=1 Tax=Aquabacterium sp. A7-Y TaxID=1349605 RepID=UPI00223E369F|nr:TPM domain-containing protein [Aquabacterium sp. A7-Y]MCW7539541.1 TPM domain-containing protein [Aquabacterium sp. A7-Y]